MGKRTQIHTITMMNTTIGSSDTDTFYDYGVECSDESDAECYCAARKSAMLSYESCESMRSASRSSDHDHLKSDEDIRCRDLGQPIEWLSRLQSITMDDVAAISQNAEAKRQVHDLLKHIITKCPFLDEQLQQMLQLCHQQHQRVGLNGPGAVLEPADPALPFPL